MDNKFPSIMWGVTYEQKLMDGSTARKLHGELMEDRLDVEKKMESSNTEVRKTGRVQPFKIIPTSVTITYGEDEDHEQP